MEKLASLYRIQGRTQEASTLQEVLDTSTGQKEGDS